LTIESFQNRLGENRLVVKLSPFVLSFRLSVVFSDPKKNKKTTPVPVQMPLRMILREDAKKSSQELVPNGPPTLDLLRVRASTRRNQRKPSKLARSRQ